MPPRAAAGGPVQVQAVHRYAFVQELMRLGYVSERDALASFKKLTGSTNGACGGWRGVADRGGQLIGAPLFQTPPPRGRQHVPFKHKQKHKH